MASEDLRSLLGADFRANKGNPKGFITVASYRIANAAVQTGKVWLRVPAVLAHRLLTEVLLGVELPADTKVGPGLLIWHGSGLVVHARSEIGANVILRHNTTLGTLNAGTDDDPDDGLAPVLADGVSVGTASVILGPVHVGSGAVVGAGSVVITDVPAGATVVGNPARVVREKAGDQE
jgi:putative colanic acid biosynthesis acetyltransferase WcaB